MVNQTEKERREAQALNRCLLWIGGGIVLELLLLLAQRYSVNYRISELDLALGLIKAYPICAGVAALCLVVCVFWMGRRLAGGKSAGLAAGLTVAAGALAVCFTLVSVFGASGLKLLLVVVPGITVLAAIYYLYQKEFFVAAVAAAAGMLFLWWCRQASWSYRLYLMAVILVVVAALCAALTRYLCKKDGVLTLGEKRIRVFSKNASPIPGYLTSAVAVLLIAAAVIWGTSVAYFALFALIALLLVLAVYYTIKLM